MAPASDNSWPASSELERWVVSAAGEADIAAQSLRRLLQNNPGYSAHLAADGEIAGIVQLFAKRFRSKFTNSDNPIQLSNLYQPLCEFAWRAVGLVYRSLMVDTNAEGCEVTSNALPKEAANQLRMLLKTNEQLGCKFKEARRSYLRELSEHRDKQRRISAQAERALESLKEHPIMFYEPLDTVLDQTTKEFVREVVEERVKLEMRSSFSQDEVNAEVARFMQDSEQKLKEAIEEMNRLRVANLHDAELRKRAQEAERLAREAAADAERQVQESCAATEQLKTKLELAEKELTQTEQQVALLEQQQQQQGCTSSTNRNNRAADFQCVDAEGRPASVQELRQQMHDKDELLDQLKRKLRDVEEEKAARSRSLIEVEQRIKDLESQQVASSGTSVLDGDPVGDQTAHMVGGSTGGTDEQSKQFAILEKELDQHMQVERSLRDANRALEKALEEAEERARHAEIAAAASQASVCDNLNSTKDRSRKTNKSKLSHDKDIQEAIQNVTAQYEQRSQEQESEIARLMDQIQQLTNTESSGNGTANQAGKSKTNVENEAGDSIRAGKWKNKYEDLQEKCTELQDENDKLDQKVSMLEQKLREKCGDDVLQETLKKIDLTPVRLNKYRKKKAYERLYDDAQRRFAEMKSKQENLAMLQESAVADAAAKVKDRTALQRLSMLASLQRASRATNERFSDAMHKFYAQQTPHCYHRSISAHLLPALNEESSCFEDGKDHNPAYNMADGSAPISPSTMGSAYNGVVGTSLHATRTPGNLSTIPTSTEVPATLERERHVLAESSSPIHPAEVAAMLRGRSRSFADFGTSVHHVKALSTKEQKMSASVSSSQLLLSQLSDGSTCTGMWATANYSPQVSRAGSSTAPSRNRGSQVNRVSIVGQGVKQTAIGCDEIGEFVFQQDTATPVSRNDAQTPSQSALAGACTLPDMLGKARGASPSPFESKRASKPPVLPSPARSPPPRCEMRSAGGESFTAVHSWGGVGELQLSRSVPNLATALKREAMTSNPSSPTWDKFRKGSARAAVTKMRGVQLCSPNESFCVTGIQASVAAQP